MELFIDLVLAIGMIITTLIVLILASRETWNLPDRILVLIFSLFLVLNIHAYAGFHHLSALFNATFIVDFLIIWLFGPLLLMYVKSLSRDQKSLFRDNYYHFVPAIMMGLFIGLPLVLSFTFDGFRFLYLEVIETHQAYIVMARNVFSALYLVYAMILTKSNDTLSLRNSGILSIEDISWARHLLQCALFIILFDLTIGMYETFVGDIPMINGMTNMMIITLFTVYLGYFGIRKCSMLLPGFLSHNDSKKQIKTSSVPVIIDNVDQVKIDFEKRIQTEKYYLDEKLTLGKLASYFGITDKQISSLLNHHIGASFHDYINMLRVEEVKRRLTTPKFSNYKIVAIAYDCGFNSKASFNRIFKNETGVTPSAFKTLLIGGDIPNN